MDLPLAPFDLGLSDVEARPARTLALVGEAEIGPDIEKVVLNPCQHGVELEISRRMQPGDPDDRVDLVHGPIGGDAQVGFRAPFAAAEGSAAVVAGASVNSVEHDHRLNLNPA